MFQYRNIICLLLFVVLAACSTAVSQPEDALKSYAGPGPMRGSGGAYLLGPGDRLRIKVYNEPELTGEYEVNAAGSVSLPLVGQIRAAGQTASALEATIVSRMKGHTSQDPKVNVEVAAYAPFYILGEVKKPGQYPYQVGLTLADAVATAGGLTYRANESAIYLRRAGSAGEQVLPLDRPVKVFPGDNIRVSERIF